VNFLKITEKGIINIDTLFSEIDKEYESSIISRDIPFYLKYKAFYAVLCAISFKDGRIRPGKFMQFSKKNKSEAISILKEIGGMERLSNLLKEFIDEEYEYMGQSYRLLQAETYRENKQANSEPKAATVKPSVEPEEIEDIILEDIEEESEDILDDIDISGVEDIDFDSIMDEEDTELISETEETNDIINEDDLDSEADFSYNPDLLKTKPTEEAEHNDDDNDLSNAELIDPNSAIEDFFN